MGTNKKKKKNSNYVTAKNIAKNAQAERAARREKNKKIAVITVSIVLAVAIIVGGIFALGYGVFGWGEPEFEVTHHATIVIKDYGTVHLELYGKEAPITVNNFVDLANKGFYNGLTFHRIMETFMAQGGDPNADGTGGYTDENGVKKTIKGEFEANGVTNRIKHKRGVISMARGGYDYNSASSQFFIVHKTSENNTEALDGQYAAFGKVIDGMSVIDKICEEAKPYDGNGGILPSQQPVIESISIHAAH